MAVNPARRDEAADRLLIGLVLIDQPRRDTARPHDLAAPVDIDQKGVQRARPLLDATLQPRPLVMGEDPWEHVEGDQPVRVATLAVNREGDTDAAEQGLGLGLLQTTELGGHRLGPMFQLLIWQTDRSVLVHLVKIRRCHALGLVLLGPTKAGPPRR